MSSLFTGAFDDVGIPVGVASMAGHGVAVGGAGYGANGLGAVTPSTPFCAFPLFFPPLPFPLALWDVDLGLVLCERCCDGVFVVEPSSQELHSHPD